MERTVGDQDQPGPLIQIDIYNLSVRIILWSRLKLMTVIVIGQKQTNSRLFQKVRAAKLLMLELQ